MILMDCDKFTELIIPYLDLELDTVRKSAFENHMEQCASCATLFRNVQLTYAIIDEERSIKASPDFYQKLVNELERDNKPKIISLLSTVLKPLAVAASVALGIMIGNGELEEVILSDTEFDVVSETITPIAPADFSIWVTMNENYGNQD